MAKKKSMTMEEALQVILASEGDNPFRAMLEFIAQSALEFEMTEHLGAAPYERTEERAGYRNGYKPRILITAVGDLHLLVPQDRGGTFSTSLFERYQRSDKALVLALMEMYVKGVSTRKVAAITEALCGRSFSSQLVSKLAKCLDEKVAEWRSRPLEGTYPYLIVDARYEKVREGGVIRSQAVFIGIGINQEGYRQVLGVELAGRESQTSWRDFLSSLRDRGLHGVEFVVSDAHEGLRKSLMEMLPEAAWQRCYVHFLRNALDHLPRKANDDCLQELRWLYDRRDVAEAQKDLAAWLSRWQKTYPKLCDWVEENIAETLTFYRLPRGHHKHLKSTNMLERLNEEIKRRTRVVRIFPNSDSCLRLIRALAVETHEGWLEEHRYLNMDLLVEHKRELLRQLEEAA